MKNQIFKKITNKLLKNSKRKSNHYRMKMINNFKIWKIKVIKFYNFHRKIKNYNR